MRKLKNDFTLEEYVDVRWEQIEWMQKTMKNLAKQAAYLMDDIEGFVSSVSDAYEEYVNIDDTDYYVGYDDAVDIDRYIGKYYDAVDMDENLVKDAVGAFYQYGREEEKLKKFYNHANKLYAEIDTIIKTLNRI